MKVGLLFGSFNPIHNGHMDIVSQAEGQVDEIWFVIHPTNPYKQMVPAPVEARLKIVQAATKKALIGQPTMRQSLELLSSDYPEHQFVLLLGQDLADGLPAWDDYKYLHAFPILVFERITPVSSSQVRTATRKGEPIRDLVPPAAHDHIVATYS